MLTRISVDNYKCLVDFHLRLGREHLFLGPNGSGKSTVFEVLSALHRLHRAEARVDELFPTSTLTRWHKRLTQTFELEALLEGSRYRYRLELSHDNDAGRGELHEEYLFVGDVPLYTATSHKLGTVHLDNGVRSNFLTDPTRSGLGSLRGAIGTPDQVREQFSVPGAGDRGPDGVRGKPVLDDVQRIVRW